MTIRNALISEAATCLEWALDLLDIYDDMALKQGVSAHIVLPELHIDAKLRARTTLTALTSSNPAGDVEHG